MNLSSGDKTKAKYVFSIILLMNWEISASSDWFSILFLSENIKTNYFRSVKLILLLIKLISFEAIAHANDNHYKSLREEESIITNYFWDTAILSAKCFIN